MTESKESKENTEPEASGGESSGSLWSVVGKAFGPLQNKPVLAYGLAFGILVVGLGTSAVLRGQDRVWTMFIGSALLLIYLVGILASHFAERDAPGRAPKSKAKISSTIKTGRGASLNAENVQQTRLAGPPDTLRVKRSIETGDDSVTALREVQGLTTTSAAGPGEVVAVVDAIETDEVRQDALEATHHAIPLADPRTQNPSRGQGKSAPQPPSQAYSQPYPEPYAPPQPQPSIPSPRSGDDGLVPAAASPFANVPSGTLPARTGASSLATTAIPTATRAALAAQITAAAEPRTHEIVAVDESDRDYVCALITEGCLGRSDRLLVGLDGNCFAPDVTDLDALAELVHSIGRRLGGKAAGATLGAIDKLRAKDRFGTMQFNYTQTVNLAEGAHGDIRDAMNTTVNLAEPDSADTTRRVADLARIAADAVRTARSGKQRVTVLIDHADVFLQGPAKAWLQQFTDRVAPDTVVHLLAHQAGLRPEPNLVRHTLAPMGSADVGVLVGDTDPERCAAILESTGGRPWAVRILAAGAHGRSGPGPVAATGGGDLAGDVWAFLEQQVFKAERAYYGPCIERISQLQAMDGAAIRAVVQDLLPVGVGVDEFISGLRELNLVDEASCDSPPTDLRLLPMIVAAARLRLARRPERLAQIHQLAADHYWARLEPADLAERDEYQYYWQRFESLEWPKDLHAWIHHARLAPLYANPAERRNARMKLTQWYLEGFFWFDMLATHKFCDGLLTAWNGWAEGNNEETRWLLKLGRFHENYGRSWEHAATEAQWAEARDAIYEIKEAVRLPGNRLPENASEETRTLARVFALATHIEADLLGFAEFSPESLEHAGRLYQTAYEWEPEDKWLQSWALCGQVDIALRLAESDELDEPALTAKLVEASATATSDADGELQSWILYFQADLWLRKGNYDAAAQALLVAILLALRYQTVQEPNWPIANNFPNNYTREHYLEVRSSVNDLIEQMAQRGEAAADEALARLREAAATLFQPFAPDLAADDLWPPAPAVTDLDELDSLYLTRARRVVQACMDRDLLAKTIETPLPWVSAFRR